jgi:hypothetical protein
VRVYEIQKVKCINHAWFVMALQIKGEGVCMISSDDIPVGKCTIIDISQEVPGSSCNIQVVIKAVMGKTKAADEAFIYKNNNQTAIYEVTGTSLDFQIRFVEIEGT